MTPWEESFSIDEAYTLKQDDNDKVGQEAIDILLKRMEDDKGKFIVIAAGYFGEMEEFLNSNTGLTSRFTKFIDFEDYTPPEMKAIFNSMITTKGMKLDPVADQVLDNLFNAIFANRDQNFANGRTVRNIFEKSLQKQAARLAPLSKSGTIPIEILNSITSEDISQ